MKLLGYVWLIALGWLALPTITAAPNPFEGATGLTAPTPIDELVLSRLQRLEIAPANLCSDAVFCRRVFLDVIGTLPTAQEARGFLDDKTPGKRSRLIDQLLDRDEFADYWAMKWCDLLRVKAEFPVNLWPNAVQSYHHWIRACLKDNLPYDQFVRLLLTANGSNFRAPPVNFYRAMQNHDPQGIAQTVALTFMGARAEKWPSDRLAGLAAFFSQRRRPAMVDKQSAWPARGDACAHTRTAGLPCVLCGDRRHLHVVHICGNADCACHTRERYVREWAIANGDNPLLRIAHHVQHPVQGEGRSVLRSGDET